MSVLQLNGYLKWLLEGVDRKGPMNHKPKRKFRVVIPYVKHVLEQLRRVMKKYAIPVFFKCTLTMKQIFTQIKEKILKESVVGPVYILNSSKLF